MAEILFDLKIVQSNNPSLKFFRGIKTLEQISYQFTIQYLKNIDSWFLNIDEVLKGVNIVAGVDLTKQFKHLEIPQGVLELTDFDGLNRDPSEDNFGDRITLKYTEVE